MMHNINKDGTHILLINMNTQINVASNSIDFARLDHIFERSIGERLPSNLSNILKGKNIIFSDTEKRLVPINGWGSRNNPYCPTTVKTIQPINEHTTISAIDSSCIQLAETEEGALYAVKSGIAIAACGQTNSHFKIGPILFYLSEDILKHSELDRRLSKLILCESESAKRLIRIRVERSIQLELSSHFVKAIILVDGPLKSSIFEHGKQGIKKVAENCSLYKNTMVGISKSTKLKILDRISLPLAKLKGPAYIEIDLIIKSLIQNTIGDNLLVKFGNNNSSPILRADVLTIDSDKNDSLGKLLGNDSIAGGYPETLQLAHHISTFTNTEVSCLKSHVLNNYGVTELASEDLRKKLLSSISV
jgi:hypothetical protein